MTASINHEPTLPALTSAQKRWLLTDLLKTNSRAFYLTLRILPRGMREPVALAYLLARAADTIADTRLLPPGERLTHLLTFRSQLAGPAQNSKLSGIVLGLSATLQQALPAEKLLLEHLPEAFAYLETLPADDAADVRDIVTMLSKGMEFDLRHFPAEDNGTPVALPDVETQERYTYLVAGCVGAFWTRMTMRHVPALKSWDLDRLSALGIRFGKALQYTNILRDIPRDLRISRCYLPAAELNACGVQASDLLQLQFATLARPVLMKSMQRALEHFVAAESYLLAIPRRCPRLRLSVLWPILIGLGTLQIVADNRDWLNPEVRCKVARAWVYRLMLRSLFTVWSNRALKRWIAELRGKLEAEMLS